MSGFAVEAGFVGQCLPLASPSPKRPPKKNTSVSIGVGVGVAVVVAGVAGAAAAVVAGGGVNNRGGEYRVTHLNLASWFGVESFGAQANLFAHERDGYPSCWHNPLPFKMKIHPALTRNRNTPPTVPL